MIIALWAALAMFAEDIGGALLTQAMARNRANLSGMLDSLTWIAGIFTAAWSLDAIDGHSLALKAVVIAAVSVANYAGSALGVKVGKRFITQSRPHEPARMVTPDVGTS
jgi:hypothetical protein